MTLSADVMGVPTVLVARTDADAAKLVTSDIDQGRGDARLGFSSRIAPPTSSHSRRGGGFDRPSQLGPKRWIISVVAELAS